MKYAELMKKQQEEVNAFPFGFAFGDKQFIEMMRRWDLCHGEDGQPTKDDLHQIRRIGGGGFVRAKDCEEMHEMFKRHHEEMQVEIEADKEGAGFIREMFEIELANHEFSYTGDIRETLDALGLTAEDMQKTNMARGLYLAIDHLTS